MSKTTVQAPANIAFIKYWGARDLERAVPRNPSISMTLDSCATRCTVELLPDGAKDEVWLSEPDGGFRPPPHEFHERMLRHLERIRAWAKSPAAFRVATKNGFPTAGGLASSASGFAALTMAAAGAHQPLVREAPGAPPGAPGGGAPGDRGEGHRAARAGHRGGGDRSPSHRHVVAAADLLLEPGDGRRAARGARAPPGGHPGLR